MTIDDLAIPTGQDGNLQPEFPDAAAHTIYCGVVLAGIAGVENQPVDVPDFYLQRLDGFSHRGTFILSPEYQFAISFVNRQFKEFSSMPFSNNRTLS